MIINFRFSQKQANSIIILKLYIHITTRIVLEFKQHLAKGNATFQQFILLKR